MAIPPPDVMCFDVERRLAKALAIKVETFVCGPHDYRLRIGLRWSLILDGEQLEGLWENADSPASLRDRFDALKPDCLVFQGFQR